jgi:hypothetical protein
MRLERKDVSWERKIKVGFGKKIMGHMNFDNLFKISRKEAVREMFIVSMENKQDLSSKQRNTLQQNH